jgi:hypothetical protein
VQAIALREKYFRFLLLLLSPIKFRQATSIINPNNYSDRDIKPYRVAAVQALYA